jgi:hypothetical protein
VIDFTWPFFIPSQTPIGRVLTIKDFLEGKEGIVKVTVIVELLPI